MPKGFFNHAVPLVPQSALAARVKRTGALALTSGVITTVAFDAGTLYDTGSFFTAASNTKLIVKYPGIYHIGACAGIESNAAGVRQLRIVADGSVLLVMSEANAVNGDLTRLNVATDYKLNKDDYVEMAVYQTSGGNLNLEIAADISPEMWIHRIA